MVVVCDSEQVRAQFCNYYCFIINVYCVMNIIPTFYLISTWNPTGCIKLLRQNILHRRFEIRMKQTGEQKEIWSYRFRACCHCLCNKSHWLHEVNRVQLTLEQQWENQNERSKNQEKLQMPGGKSAWDKRIRKYTTTLKCLKFFLLKTINNRPAGSDHQLYKQADFKPLAS